MKKAYIRLALVALSTLALLVMSCSYSWAAVKVHKPTPEARKSSAVDNSTWYLAEGSTALDFEMLIGIENPNQRAVDAKITYMTTEGPISGSPVHLPAMSQALVDPSQEIGERDFSTKVHCVQGLPIAVDRTMVWGTEANPGDGHSSVGVTAPSGTWYLPEGSSDWSFECWLLIQNPGNAKANCKVTYMIEGDAPVQVSKTVSANSRSTFNMADDIGQKDASIKVTSNVPVIAERAMYRNNRREGHDSIGTTSPASSYYLAEGSTDYGFITYVLVQNPNPSEAAVAITYMTTKGAVGYPSFSMAANSRKTIRVNDFLPNTDFSTQVHGSKPIIAERAMYWGADTSVGEACHDSIGLDSPHKSFYFPYGDTIIMTFEEGDVVMETWTLVQNPNPVDVTVNISYLTPSGQGNVTIPANIPANSRRTFNMVDCINNATASTIVECKTSGMKIMAERAIYMSVLGYRPVGMETIGAYSD